jgi:regulator of replication initiation timing
MCGAGVDFYMGDGMNEREAYIAGDTALADALGRIEDLQQALGESVAREQELEADVEHLKRILRDALADDCWRERAEAQLS